MSGIGAFLNSFAATTFEGQKRKQEFMQFQMQLAMQQAALQQQQMNMQTQNQQFQQEMKLRESKRQDELAQNKIQNQQGQERLGLEKQNIENQAAVKTQAEAERERQHKAETERKYAEARNSPKIIGLKSDIAMLKGLNIDTSQLEAELEKSYQELGGKPPEEGGAAPAQQGGQQTAQAAPGQAQAGPLTGEAGQAQQSAQGQPVAQNGPPGIQRYGLDVQTKQPMAPDQAQPQPQQISQQPQQAPAPQQASPRGAAPPQQAQPAAAGQQQMGQLREIPVSDTREEERLNQILKARNIPAYAISPETKQKNERQKAKDTFDAAVAEAQFAGMPDQVGSINDLLRQAGVNADIEAHQKGTKIQSRRASGRIGGSIMSSGMSFGGTESKSEQTVPTIDIFPKVAPSTGSGMLDIIMGDQEDTSIQTTAKIADTLWDAAINKGVKVSQPYVGAVKDVARDRIDDQLGSFRSKPEIEAGSFDSVIDQKRYQAAHGAVALTKIDQQLKQMSEKNGMPYDTLAVPVVKDAPETQAQTLQRFDRATKQIGATFPNLMPSKSEGAMLSELETRMAGKPLDADGRAEAASVLAKTMNSTRVSDQYKQGVQKILTPLINQADTDQTQMAAKKASQAKGPTAALEEGSRRQAGGMVASAENVKAATQAWGTVSTNTKDKESAAKAAVDTVKTNYDQMTEVEKKKAQDAWKAKRANASTWKKVSEPVRKDMNEAVGLARNDGFTA